MGYQAELDFLIRTLRRMRLETHLVQPGDSLKKLDFGLRATLGLAELNYEALVNETLRFIRSGTVYKLLDQFWCHYIFFSLPRREMQTTLIIGPYLTHDPTREQILEAAEQYGIPLNYQSHLSDFYASLPIFSDPSPIMALVSTLGETLWGSMDAFEVVDINYEHSISMPAFSPEAPFAEQTDILVKMQQMEDRYTHENKLMEIVSKGLTQQAELFMASISHLNFQHRLPDPLRNIKNYCIICNTLLRKAAQDGGVHPIHLDNLSSHYARQIENAPHLEAGNALIGEMIRAYCRLVRTHSGRHFSAVVQRIKTYIDANLSGDLSLQGLAALMKLTPAYLSTIFHKETGETLTAYVSGQRMKAAMHLLQTSRLQIQNIAQLCGCPDPNYFAKLFKRHFGIPPSSFRKDYLAPNAINP